MRNTINPQIIHEAIQITKDLGDVVFIGATALLLHDINNRTTKDIDFVILIDKTDDKNEFLLERNYITTLENGKPVTRTPSPRRFKVDVYNEPISNITIKEIFDKAVEKKYKKGTVKVASIETLIVLKHRAGRTQDVEDISSITKKYYHQINDTKLSLLCQNNTEMKEIKNALTFHYKS